MRASGPAAPGGRSGSATSSRPSTQAAQPLEHSTRAQSPSVAVTRTGSSASSHAEGSDGSGAAHVGSPSRGVTWVGRNSLSLIGGVAPGCPGLSRA